MWLANLCKLYFLLPKLNAQTLPVKKCERRLRAFPHEPLVVAPFDRCCEWAEESTNSKKKKHPHMSTEWVAGDAFGTGCLMLVEVIDNLMNGGGLGTYR